MLRNDKFHGIHVQCKNAAACVVTAAARDGVYLAECLEAKSMSEGKPQIRATIRHMATLSDYQSIPILLVGCLFNLQKCS